MSNTSRNVQILEQLKRKLKASPAVKRVRQTKSYELTFNFSDQDYRVIPEDVRVSISTLQYAGRKFTNVAFTTTIQLPKESRDSQHTYERHALMRYVDPYKPSGMIGEGKSLSQFKLKDVKYMYDQIMGVKENYYKRTGDI